MRSNQDSADATSDDGIAKELARGWLAQGRVANGR